MSGPVATVAPAAPATADPVARARDVLQGRTTLAGREALALAKALKAANEFSYARRVLRRASEADDVRADAALRLRVAQERALCTSKDDYLPAESRFPEALRILREDAGLDASTEAETLGLAGAACKYWWMATHRKDLLERSLGYYLRGHQAADGLQKAYPGVNAAFVLDLLALQETQAAGGKDPPPLAKERHAQADAIRRELVEVLTPHLKTLGSEAAMWDLVTLGEAHFGLGEYDKAEAWLRRAKARPPEPWQLETTARQLATLASIRGELESPRARRVLSSFLDGHPAALDSALTGKVGLALSGGGFRASLYHLGVLAYLAEADLLRRVEVVSCVSGGSIVGTQYYLELRKLLRETPDAELTQKHYLDLVEKVQRDFLAGVQRNLRTRVATDLVRNFQMVFTRAYSRTHRLGELYERELFSRVQDEKGGVWEGDKLVKPGPERHVSDLVVQPEEGPQGFNPRRHNWTRANKVPILILNATTLNTGHNWQFSATWMGEPAASIDADVDGNDRLRRVAYRDSETAAKVRLGHAVAASSCVPGLFHPLELDGIHQGHTVRLVDGGVHDNQGVASLLEQGCDVILVSDASGQMTTKTDPPAGLPFALLRVKSIFESRIRGSQIQDLEARRQAGILQGLMVVHLKQGIQVRTVDWTGCHDPYDPKDDPHPLNQPAGHGIPERVLKRLSEVRTDLDSFTETEAYSLMACGYRMTRAHRPETLLGLPPAPAAGKTWPFLAVDEDLTQAQHREAYDEQLEAASQIAFKVWKISKPLRVASWLLAGLALLAGGLAWWTWRDVSLLTVGSLGLALLGLAAALILPAGLAKALNPRKAFREALAGILLAIAGFILAWIHLKIFDSLFLKLGKVPEQSEKGQTRSLTPS